MTDRDPQEIWDEYYSEKKRQRLAEAEAIWALMVEAGVLSDTVLALDFTHFASRREDAESLADQLSENYTMHLDEGEADGYVFARGTTRPYGMTLTVDQHREWVEFMADVGQSHGCVFSAWEIEAPSLGASFHSERIDSAS